MNIRLLWLVLFAAAPAALAQNFFVVLQDNGPQVVRGLNLGNALIEVNGQLTPSSGTLFTLQKAAGYRPGFITFSDMALKSVRIEDSTGGTLTTYGTDIDGYVQSTVALKHCFIVLEITTPSDKGNYASELPDLAAGESRRIRISARVKEPLEESNYVLHVFSEGLELLNSRMTPSYVEEQTRKTEELMLKKQPDRAVRMQRGAAPAVPVYPADLKAQSVAGAAKVSCTIDIHGDVVAVEVLETTNPLFGESLAAAARQWKFEPAVKDHQYVQATAVIPYTFKPQAAPAGGTPKP